MLQNGQVRGVPYSGRIHPCETGLVYTPFSFTVYDIRGNQLLHWCGLTDSETDYKLKRFVLLDHLPLNAAVVVCQYHGKHNSIVIEDQHERA